MTDLHPDAPTGPALLALVAICLALAVAIGRWWGPAPATPTTIDCDTARCVWQPSGACEDPDQPEVPCMLQLLDGTVTVGP